MTEKKEIADARQVLKEAREILQEALQIINGEKITS